MTTPTQGPRVAEVRVAGDTGVVAHAMAHPFTRFVLAGAFNTAVTYGAYLALLHAWPPMAAYASTYAAGVVLSYLLNARVVFRVAPSWRGFARFPIVHLVQAALSFTLFHALVDTFGVPAGWAPLPVIACTVPITYLLARRVMARDARGAPLPRSPG